MTLPAECVEIFQPRLLDAVTYVVVFVGLIAAIGLLIGFIGDLSRRAALALIFYELLAISLVIVCAAAIYHAAWVDYERCWQ